MKSLWWVFLLIIAGAIIFFLSFYSSRPAANQGVVLNDIFPQSSTGMVAALPEKQGTVPPMAVVTTPVNGKGSGFTIQVYSFQDKNRAQNALQALKSNGYQAFLIATDLGPKGVWYRVRVGGIMDEAQAHKMLEVIRKNYSSGFILKPQAS